MKEPVQPSRTHLCLPALVLCPVLLSGACAGDGGGGVDAAPAGPDARADLALLDGTPADLKPLYACPSELPAPAPLDGGVLPSRRPAAPLPVLPPPLTPGTLPATDVVFSVDTSQGLWSISQDIYGMNSPGPKRAVDPTLRITTQRLGGNRLSAYNWENNASNAGKDYQYQSDGYLSASDAAGDAVRFVMVDAHSVGGGTVVTVPIGDYVSADKGPGGDVRKSGDDYLATRFRKNVAAKGAPLSNQPNLDDDSVYQDEFVAWAKGCAGTQPLAFSLDNEPDLWRETHPEIHPQAVTYDELCSRTVEFASTIKAVWPAAPILGFVSYGWNGYTTLQGAPDGRDKGDFIDYFLTQMKAAEANAGRRLVDYLDLHWYPEATGGGARIVFTTPPTDPAKLAAYREARLQAPRSLWDPTYKEASWITNSNLKAPINLIPRIRDKIAANYPGTKLAFTEWNYGGGSDITGALATADVLGILGRERVDMAHIWLLSGKEPFTYAGVRVFRNFDGKSGEFGDVGLAASNSDPVNTSVYASLSSSDPGRVVLVAINKKSDVPVTAGIRLAHPANLGSAKVYVLAGTDPEIAAGAGILATDTNAFSYTMPPHSVSVLVFNGEVPVPVIDGGVALDGGGAVVDGGGVSAIDAAGLDASTVDLASADGGSTH